MILSTPEFFAAFLSAIQLYFPQQLDPNLRSPNLPQPKVAEEYDFVIIGGGTAGCVLARRLTENSDWKVLMIEAGRNDDYISDTPFLGEFILNSEIDYNYTSVPQERGCLSLGGICGINRGKVIGGTSTINALQYVRGNKADYDEWERLGNKGWSYNDLLPYFIKAENNTEPRLANSRYHGSRGPMNVQYPRFITPMREEYIKAGEEIGWRFGDLNGRNQSVIDYQQLTIDGALRESTSRAYLYPVRNRKNLNVILDSTVTKIIIENGTAKGVEYIRNNNTYTVSAKKDVILSAGTVDTPKLLMLSGIGPRKELERHDINVVKDLPVGGMYVDHGGLYLFYELNNAPTSTPNIWKTNESIVAYARDRKGPLSMAPLGCEAASFFNNIDTNKPPSVETTYCSSGRSTTDADGERHIIRIILLNVDPMSIGNLKLRSNDYRDSPLIDPKLFSNDKDRVALEDGVLRLMQFMETETMSKYSPRLYTKLTQPNCTGLSGRQYARCAVRQYSILGAHPIGTAKMGPINEKDTVVCSKDLVVKGVKRLRVIDASVMPKIPRANTYAAVVTVAEKGADLIKKDYQ